MTEKNKKNEKAMSIYVGSEKTELAVADITTKEQVNLLASPTPQKYIKKRKGRGGRYLDYVEGHYMVNKLNAIFGFNWDFNILDTTRDGDQLVCRVELKVRFANGQEVVKSAYGSKEISKSRETEEVIDLGDDYKAAATDGLKKAASLLSLCWDVYSGQTAKEWKGEDMDEEIRAAQESADKAAGGTSKPKPRKDKPSTIPPPSPSQKVLAKTEDEKQIQREIDQTEFPVTADTSDAIIARKAKEKTFQQIFNTLIDKYKHNIEGLLGKIQEGLEEKFGMEGTVKLPDGLSGEELDYVNKRLGLLLEQKEEESPKKNNDEEAF